VTCKPLHKTGVTVPATMTASDIGVDAVVKTGDGRFCQNSLGKDLSNFHTNIIMEIILIL
jgi:hypothetical protein